MITDSIPIFKLDIVWKCPKCGFIIKKHEETEYLDNFLVKQTKIILEVLEHIAKHF